MTSYISLIYSFLLILQTSYLLVPSINRLPDYAYGYFYSTKLPSFNENSNTRLKCAIRCLQELNCTNINCNNGFYLKLFSNIPNRNFVTCQACKEPLPCNLYGNKINRYKK